MKIYVYLPGPHLLDQFPFTSVAVCNAYVCVRMRAGKTCLPTRLEGVELKKKTTTKKTAELKPD